MDSSDSMTRRRLLRRSAGTAVASAGMATAGSATAQEDAYGGYLSDDDTFGSVTHDGSGRDEVEVTVGAEGNQGTNAFDPSAVLVDPETTVKWVWSGNGSHNVVSEDDEFTSDLSGEEGFTFEQEFTEAGVYQYFCQPHKGLGMKGVIVVGEDNVETELVELGREEDEGLNTAAIWSGAAVFGAIAVLGVAAYNEIVNEQTVYGAEEEH